MEPRNFDEFWPYYVGEHRLVANRALHYTGTSGFLLLVAAGAATLNPWAVAAGPVVGYGFAWVGHFFVEKNRPASFSYPAWSFLADMKMLAYGVTGRMAGEVARLEKSGFRLIGRPA